MSGEASELVDFLSHNQVDVRLAAVNHVQGLCATPEGAALLRGTPVVRNLLRLTGDSQKIAARAYSSLINLSADNAFSEEMIAANTLARMLTGLRDEESVFREMCAILLSNLTRLESGARKLLETPRIILELSVRLSISEVAGPRDKDPFCWLSTCLLNLTQLEPGRRPMLGENSSLLRVLPNLMSPNPYRRRGAAGVLRNCALEQSAHTWLLEECDAVGFALRPLATSAMDPLDADELAVLPLAVSHVLRRGDARGEPDEEIRVNLLDTLMLLTATRPGRDYLRAHAVYPFIRNLDRVEEAETVKEAIYRIVSVIMLDEQEDQGKIAGSVGRNVEEFLTGRLPQQGKPAAAPEEDNRQDHQVVVEKNDKKDKEVLERQPPEDEEPEEALIEELFSSDEDEKIK